MTVKKSSTSPRLCLAVLLCILLGCNTVSGASFRGSSSVSSSFQAMQHHPGSQRQAMEEKREEEDDEEEEEEQDNVFVTSPTDAPTRFVVTAAPTAVNTAFLRLIP